MLNSSASMALGSPPHMRGKVCIVVGGVSASGITPAYAGKSKAGQATVYGGSDHPPRMRGKASRKTAADHGHRITPAYAGKRDLTMPESLRARDHPRVCGEKPFVYCGEQIPWGSPPRMRGKVAGAAVSRAGPRITPAYAGKSL